MTEGKQAALRGVKHAVIKSDDALRGIGIAIAKARTEGASWSDIGRALGVTRQEAHRRWSGLVALINEDEKELQPLRR